MGICLTLTEIDWALTKDVVGIFSSVFAALASLGVFILGLKGLQTWRAQLKGSGEYDLAKRLVVTIKNYKAEVNSLTGPFVAAYEMVLTADEANGLSDDQKIHRGLVKAYGVRMQRVHDALMALYTDMILGTALWGEEFGNYHSSLEKLHKELRMAHMKWVRNQDPRLPLHVIENNLKNDQDDVRGIFNALAREQGFSEDLESLVKSIDAFLIKVLTK